MKHISLDFEGYWLEAHKASMPAKGGVYCVYASTYYSANDKVSLRKLLYVGESENVRDRIANHNRLADWKKHLLTGETLCYSFSSVSSTDRLRAEAAVINHHKPPCNVEYKYSFPFEDTAITTSGANALLSVAFTVKKH